MDYFKPGTLGNELYDDISEKRKIERMLEEPELDFRCHNTLPKSQVRRYEKATAQIGELEELNSDELLRQQGFYDSTDKRCCINQKKS